MGETIDNFINSLLTKDNPVVLERTIIDILAEYGFNKFTYLGFNPPNSTARTFFQTNYPEDWVQRYNEKNYFYIDPILLNAKSSLLPFRWEANEFSAKSTRNQKWFFQESEDFGIKQGVVIPIHAPGGEFATLGLASDESEKEIKTIWKHKIHELHLIGIYYHAAIWENVLRRKIEPTPVLSPRELQSLEWAARGKTVWEASKIMGISEASTKSYLRGAMQKLNTFNKTHAVSKALIHGLIKV